MSNPDDVARRLGLEKSENGYDLNSKSLLAGIGGPLGIAEAVLPATTFSIVFAITALRSMPFEPVIFIDSVFLFIAHSMVSLRISG